MAEQTTKKDDKSNAAASSSSATAQQGAQQKEIPNLGALDEDDEFEEFEAQDWLDKDSSLAHLSSEGGATGMSMSGERGGSAGDHHLWEDNWDDDDVEDDFGQVLRSELEKQSAKQGQPMSTS